jgi:hypothetical protein
MGSMIWLVIMAFCRHTRQQIRADQVKPSILVRPFVVADPARERTYRTRSVRAFCDRKPGAHVPATPNTTVPWSLFFVPVQRRHQIRTPFGFSSWCRVIDQCMYPLHTKRSGSTRSMSGVSFFILWPDVSVRVPCTLPFASMWIDLYSSYGASKGAMQLPRR